MSATMNETRPAEAAPPPAGEPETKPRETKPEGSFIVFVFKLALVVLIFRSFVFSPFNIPSESMLPRLWDGDYLLAAKWPYGYTSASIPFGAPLIPGRILADEPERGDMVIFKHPIDGADYIKRVVGLPGDQIEMISGVLYIDGEAVPKERIEDFVIPVSPNTPCAELRFVARAEDGTTVCRYPQFRETLPNGVSYEVLDFGPSAQDTTDPIVVPEGTMFLMGDNRDNSLDSRYPAAPGAGIGLVPQDRLIGRASVMMWSTDGSVVWWQPWTWFTAARWNRIGQFL